MSDYPYLAALLPTLNFGDTDFPSSERFLMEAEKWLTEEEYATLSGVSMSRYMTREHPMELVDEFYRFERRVRQDIAAFVESRRLGHDHKTEMFPTAYLKDTTPLEAERRLLQLRWDYISSRLGTHYGDLHALVVYRLEIEILTALAAFDADLGEERFVALTDTDAVPMEVSAD